MLARIPFGHTSYHATPFRATTVPICCSKAKCAREGVHHVKGKVPNSAVSTAIGPSDLGELELLACVPFLEENHVMVNFTLLDICNWYLNFSSIQSRSIETALCNIVPLVTWSSKYISCCNLEAASIHRLDYTRSQSPSIYPLRSLNHVKFTL